MPFMDQIFVFGAKYLIFILAALALYWFLRMTRDEQRKMAIFGCVSLPLTYIIGFVASLLYYNPRPFVTGGFTPLIAHVENNGFPSDHALAAFALAAVFFAFNKKRASMLFVLAAIVAFSRVIVGVHHYLDIEASLIFAIIGWYLAFPIVRRIENALVKK